MCRLQANVNAQPRPHHEWGYPVIDPWPIRTHAFMWPALPQQPPCVSMCSSTIPLQRSLLTECLVFFACDASVSSCSLHSLSVLAIIAYDLVCVPLGMNGVGE